MRGAAEPHRQVAERMTDFQQDIVKILLDKGLLGLIAIAFGYYLSRLLEHYRARKSYELFVWQQRVDGIRRMMELVTSHYEALTGFYDVLDRLAEKYPEHLNEDEAKGAYAFIEQYGEFERKIKALTPLLTAEVLQAASRYVDETSKLTDIVKGKFDRGKPSREDLLWALARFQQACGAVIAAGPFAQPKIEQGCSVS